jgi:hypothetical protein
MMTTLLIQTELMPLMVNFPAIAPMTEAQFYEFCLANRDLRWALKPRFARAIASASCLAVSNIGMPFR